MDALSRLLQSLPSAWHSDVWFEDVEARFGFNKFRPYDDEDEPSLGKSFCSTAVKGNAKMVEVLMKSFFIPKSLIDHTHKVASSHIEVLRVMDAYADVHALTRYNMFARMVNPHKAHLFP